jgi:hypothetical protein
MVQDIVCARSCAASGVPRDVLLFRDANE